MRRIVVKLIIVGVVLAATPPAGASVTLSSVDGNWANPDGGVDIIYVDNVAVTYGSQEQDQIRWGTPSDGTNKSGLGFTGIAPPGKDIVMGEAFDIGQLQHFNYVVRENTAANAVDLAITLDFDGGSSAVFDFSFSINETLNTSAQPDDIIDFQIPASQVVQIDGQAYTLELLGFGDSPDSLIDEFVSPEEQINDTLLWGQMSEVPHTPAPGAVILAGLGSGIVGWLRRRRCL